MRDERISIINNKINQISKEYGMKIVLNNSCIPDDVDDINVDSINSLISSIAKIRGTYLLNKGNDRQYKIINRSSSTNKPLYTSYNYEFDECELSSTNGQGHYIANCSVTWDEDTLGNICHQYVDASVYSVSMLQGYCNNNVTSFVNKYKEIIFSGTVEYNTTYPSSPIIIFFNVSGKCNSSTGNYIVWN